MHQNILIVYDAVLGGDIAQIETFVDAALQSGFQAETILNQGLIAAMDEVGHKYAIGDYYVPEMLVAAKAMKAGLGLLKPYLVERGVEPKGKVAIGTVQGDLHDIGKNLVAMMLEGAGFEIIDLGVNVRAEEFVKAAKDGAVIIGLSALLTTTMPRMSEAVEALCQSGIREKVKVIIGGAPVTQAHATQIGADGFAPDASSAVSLIRSLSPNKF